MAERRIDYGCRYKDYTAEVTINDLPVNEEQMSGLIAFIDYVKERTDVSVVIRIKDEFYEDDVPQAVLLTKSPYGLYMELTYSMEEWEWDYPLLLANDHLTEEEAGSVLVSIFHECTDDNQIVFHHFGEISSSIYPKEEDSGDTAESLAGDDGK